MKHQKWNKSSQNVLTLKSLHAQSCGRTTARGHHIPTFKGEREAPMLSEKLCLLMSFSSGCSSNSRDKINTYVLENLATTFIPYLSQGQGLSRGGYFNLPFTSFVSCRGAAFFSRHDFCIFYSHIL